MKRQRDMVMFTDVSIYLGTVAVKVCDFQRPKVSEERDKEGITSR